ncbi:histidine kinase [Mycobacterium heckeshornense]|nr:ATP-binding protein [Mycobacterium heckeshornense]KMV22190.1 histidine kinase [Mycobacterium heckeshornense]
MPNDGFDDDLDAHAAEPTPAKRPPRWSMRNWPVRWKVVAIALVPLLLAMVFGGLRIAGAMTDASNLRLAADRAEVVPAITKYMSALDVAVIATSTGSDVEGAKKNYEARKDELQARLADTDVAPDVRTGVGTLLTGGQALLDKIAANSIGLRDRVTMYAPILLTAENAVDGSVRVDNTQIRAAAQGLSRAIGARGQMMMQRLLITRGGDLPEPELRTSMITLAGTEPSTLFGMAEVLGVGSSQAKTLQQQMVRRMAIMSDPTSQLVNNPELLRSVQTTDAIAAQVIKDTTGSVTKSLEDRANSRRDAAIRDAVLVLAAFVAALVVVWLVARSLIQPLRVLRDSALKVAHEDLEGEIARVRAGDEHAPKPLPVYTTEEIGQVAHAVDELHTQALLLAGDEARLRLLVNDMFETMSRRNRSLVDQQLALIDRLERNEEDPGRLDSLFRLDHLAARMRRNGANLLVLAGAPITREQRGPLALSTVIDAATSEVEDYRRVETATVPDCTITGAAAGDIVHMLAELIDNALRYSPPTSPVRVSAVWHRNGGVLVQIVDSGLGMTDGDRRIANIRLRAGGEVTPDNARHMGLFVVGRLADRHGMRVRLRSSAPEGSSGTTAEVYLPPNVLVGLRGAPPPARTGVAFSRGPAAAETTPARAARRAHDAERSATVAAEPSDRNGSHATGPPGALLPRRKPGSSGITGVPAPPTAAGGRPEELPRREQPATRLAQTDQESPAEQPAPGRVSDTSAYFSSRSGAARADDAAASGSGRGQSPADQRGPGAEDRDAKTAAAKLPTPAKGPEEDVIYQRMLSEWLVDPHDLARSADLDWKSVWDHGWSTAAEVENVPVRSRTAHGLPVREPGARLVPGTAVPDAAPQQTSQANGAVAPSNRHGRHQSDQDHGVASNGGFHSGRHQASPPDPEAIRASMSSHFGGVRAGRSHARETTEGSDHE